jgi:hypothetical protein
MSGSGPSGADDGVTGTETGQEPSNVNLRHYDIFSTKNRYSPEEDFFRMSPDFENRRQVDPFLIEYGYVKPFELKFSKWAAPTDKLVYSQNPNFSTPQEGDPDNIARMSVGEFATPSQFERLWGIRPGESYDDVYKFYDEAYKFAHDIAPVYPAPAVEAWAKKNKFGGLDDERAAAILPSLSKNDEWSPPKGGALVRDLEKVLNWYEYASAQADQQYLSWEKQFGKYLGGGARFARPDQGGTEIKKQTLLSGAA